LACKIEHDDDADVLTLVITESVCHSLTERFPLALKVESISVKVLNDHK